MTMRNTLSFHYIKKKKIEEQLGLQIANNCAIEPWERFPSNFLMDVSHFLCPET